MGLKENALRFRSSKAPGRDAKGQIQAGGPAFVAQMAALSLWHLWLRDRS